jgi:hypothetical protein
MTTPLPSLSKLQKAFPEGGTATPPQDDGAMLGPAGGLAARLPAASSKAVTAAMHPRLLRRTFMVSSLN